MKAVMADVPADILAHRKRTGADRWDEMWNGVLHMSPAPTRTHQDFIDAFKSWLISHWARPFGNRVHREVNLASIGGWSSNYRIPDLVLLTPDRFWIDHDTYFEGPPLVVVELHSPGDETYDKFDFYAELGVPEVWVIHRESQQPEIYQLDNGSYPKVAADDAGWIASTATHIRFRSAPAKRLDIQLADQDATRVTLPE